MRKAAFAFAGTLAAGLFTSVAYSYVVPPGVTCQYPGPCMIPNSRTVHVTADVDLTGAVSFQLVMDGQVRGNRAVTLADVTTYPAATISFPLQAGPGTYTTIVRTVTQYGWRDSTPLTLTVVAGNPRVTVPE